ncbi:MAG TPA: polysaccharide ABC transporter ATP-binding protein [Chitinophagaceae bacterium]|nr:polysaccharide ABC transporter ATP-binding protein [Chitinophagaceae bacterium]
MKKDVAIRVEGLSKLYRLGEISSGTIHQDFQRWLARVRGQEDPYHEIGADYEYSRGFSWALNDVSFELQKGEILGVIGKNGAGKSTLLKILSKITRPTKGHVYLDGRVASLLEIGTGFHPEMTGRENIFMNGAILGMKRHEIKSKFDEIVEFSGIGKYIDTPVKRYSSGMYMRLGFSVTAFLEPEILIIDEVLAVGDIEFQSKCLGRINEVSKNDGRTVLFVSHNMDAIRSLCTQSILLDKGKLVKAGETEEVLREYSETALKERELTWVRTKASDMPFIERISIELDGIQPNLELILDCQCVAPDSGFKKSNIAIDIKNGFGVTIMQAIPDINPFITLSKEPVTIKTKVYLQGLIPDKYFVSVWLGPHNTETYDWVQDAVSFEVLHTPTRGRIFPHTLNHGSIVPKSEIISIS